MGDKMFRFCGLPIFPSAWAPTRTRDGAQLAGPPSTDSLEATSFPVYPFPPSPPQPPRVRWRTPGSRDKGTSGNKSPQLESDSVAHGTDAPLVIPYPVNGLPQELILNIFNLLAPPGSLYTHAFDFIPDIKAITNDHNTVSSPDDAQLDVVHGILVCRAWSLAGISILYARPYLISDTSVELFARTLWENYSLASLVKDLFFLDQNYRQMFKPGRRRLTPSPVSLIETLRACSSISRLTITSHYRDCLSSPFTSSLLQAGLYRTMLRKLVIFGTPISIGMLDIPPLEELYVREMSFDLECYFPSLHTLVVAQCDIFIFDQSPKSHFPLKSYPYLRNLELYENYAGYIMDPALLQRLHRLHLVGPAEVMVFEEWGQTPYLDNLRHLTLGYSYSFKDDPTPYLPSALETLTFLVHLQVDLNTVRPFIEPGNLEDIRHLLSSPYLECPMLRLLTIKRAKLRGPDATECNQVIQEIEALCEDRGTTLETTDDGTCCCDS